MKYIKKQTLNIQALLVLAVMFSCSQIKEEISLCDVYQDKFLIGVALNSDQILGKDSAATKIAEKYFNSITAENAMKWGKIHPYPGIYEFEAADKFVEFGQQNNMFIVGHTLIWHSQTPDWIFEDEKGELTSRDTLLKRMKDHIYTVVGRYKGKVDGWDVINEAFEDDGSWRQTKWFQIIGDVYIQKAFEYAHEADPNAELYYNDFSMTKTGKRNSVIKLVNDLMAKGIQIDGIGLQMHAGMDYPDLNDLKESIEAYASTGSKVMITEMDITVLPFPTEAQGADIALKFELNDKLNPYPDSLPDSVSTALANRYADFFKIFIQYSDKISRVTAWGINDAHSWRNNWPVRGRTDYPLLFDRNNNPKKAFNAIINLTNNKE